MPLVSHLLDMARNSGYPEESLSLIPESCPECGMPMIMRAAFTDLSCSDPRCPIKVSQRVVAIAQSLGVLGIGDSVALKFVRSYNLRNPFGLLDIQSGDYELYPNINPKVNQTIASSLKKALDVPMTLSEYVTLAYLPGIQSSTATAVFKGFSSLDDAYAYIESNGVQGIQHLLGINHNTVSLKAGQVYETLREFKVDLYEGISGVSLYDAGSLKDISVCISDSAGAPFASKRDFQNKANSVAKSCGYHISWAASVTRTLDVLVNDGSRYTSKVKKANQYGIPTMAGQELISQMKGGSL